MGNILIEFNVKYPLNHEGPHVIGHNFIVKEEDLEATKEFVLKCVKINGGKCSLRKETILIFKGEIPQRIISDYIKIIRAVFQITPDIKKMVKLERIWKKILDKNSQDNGNKQI